MTREKAIGLFRLRLNNIMTPFNMYGLQFEVPGAIEQIIKEAEELHINLKNAGLMLTDDIYAGTVEADKIKAGMENKNL